MPEFWNESLTYGGLFWMWFWYAIVGSFIWEFLKALWNDGK